MKQIGFTASKEKNKEVSEVKESVNENVLAIVNVAKIIDKEMSKMSESVFYRNEKFSEKKGVQISLYLDKIYTKYYEPI